uniref:Macaca fascicularis brain cDNA clone: QflA-19642, similar to human sperm associated antigen 9 (SPAG9), transcript variant1, mRNA, RefSeq: NM_003971.3 n=1 Tax=Macaca fascicularis TaxID=9541 RepID=I7GIG4_MACFA|nr:unnamed protein product [Macaca fascicularis]
MYLLALLKMKRSQKFKQSLNLLLSWIWTKISVDIKVQALPPKA